jgi:hypothetical protein
MQALETKNLPANVTQGVTMRQAIQEKIEFLNQEEKKIKAAKKILTDALEKNDNLFKELHKEHGDFEVGGFTVKVSVTHPTVVLDESRLPKECFTYKPIVSLTKVKELIIAGVIPKDVAIQQTTETIKVK